MEPGPWESQFGSGNWKSQLVTGHWESQLITGHWESQLVTGHYKSRLVNGHLRVIIGFRLLGVINGYLLSPDEVRGYNFGVVCVSVRRSIRSVRPSLRTFCLSGTLSQYLLVRFNSFLVQMISTMDS